MSRRRRRRRGRLDKKDLTPASEVEIEEEQIPAIMVAFDVENGTDATDLYQKAGAIKLPYNKDNVKLWFGQLETKMRFLGIKSQFLKLQVLSDRLPPEVINEVTELVCISEDSATATCYKDNLMPLLGYSCCYYLCYLC